MKISRRTIYIIISATLVVGTVTGILVNRHNKKKKIKQIDDILEGNKPSSGGGQVIIPQSAYDKLPAGYFPLKVKDKNKKVYDLQKNLNRNYGTSIDLDGVFGMQTYDALCDKYWSWCGSSIGLYQRTIDGTDFDEIKNKKAETA